MYLNTITIILKYYYSFIDKKYFSEDTFCDYFELNINTMDQQTIMCYIG